MAAQAVFIGLADLVGGEGGAFDNADFVEVTVEISRVYFAPSSY